MKKRAGNQSSSTLADITETRRTAAEVVVVGLVLALGVNLVSSSIQQYLGDIWMFICGLAILLTATTYIMFRYFGKRTLSRKISFVVPCGGPVDNGGIAKIKDYEPSERLANTAKAVLTENPALRQQWESQPFYASISVSADGSIQSPPQNSTGNLLLIELVEYLVLQKLSTHLNDYFRRGSYKKKLLQNLARKDIPSVLLTNRALELISRDMRDRPAFSNVPQHHTGYDPDRFSIGSFEYSKLSLTLPKGSSVERSSSDSVTIRNRSIALDIQVSYQNIDYFADPDFSRYYIGNFSRLKLVKITVSASVSRRLIAYRSDLAYHQWVESFIAELHEHFDFDRFMEAIGWWQIKTALTVANNLLNADSAESIRTEFEK